MVNCVTNVSIIDTSLGFTIQRRRRQTMALSSHQTNGRFNFRSSRASTPSRRACSGCTVWAAGSAATTFARPSRSTALPVTYTFLNQDRQVLTQFVSPNLQVDQLNPDLALFVQDQCRLNRVTITAGLRLRLAPRIRGRRRRVPDGALVPPQSFPAIKNVPNWKDLSPRLGIVWDPQGDGKTAVKFGINRYVASATTGIANLFDPFGPGNSLSSTARTRAIRTGTSCRTATSGSRRRTASAARC